MLRTGGGLDGSIAAKEEFEEAVNRLGFNLARLKAINNHNNELIEQSFQYRNLQAILNGDIAGTYSDKGRPVDEKGHQPTGYPGLSVKEDLSMTMSIFGPGNW